MTKYEMDLMKVDLKLIEIKKLKALEDISETLSKLFRVISYVSEEYSTHITNKDMGYTQIAQETIDRSPEDQLIYNAKYSPEDKWNMGYPHHHHRWKLGDKYANDKDFKHQLIEKRRFPK